MDIQIAVSKINQFGSPESGDTVEVIERPNGGISIVMADGQTAGASAKWISTLAVRKVISLLSEGIRDGAAARAASDYLFTERKGNVSATLNVLSVDMQTGTLVITRNNPAPLLLARNDQISRLEEPCDPIGLFRDTRPLITELPLEPGLTTVMFTDGLAQAGSHNAEQVDVMTCLQAYLEEEDPSPQAIADSLIEQAIRLEQGRPRNDISVVALRVARLRGDAVRRMTVRLPLTGE